MSNNSKNILLGVLALGLLSISIAYASFSTRLSVSGTTQASQTTWDIHFDSFSTSSTPAKTALDEPNTGTAQSISTSGTKVTSLNVNLKKPGDLIVYTFDIENDGTIDAELQTFNKTITCPVQSDCDNITYTVTCTDSNSNTLVQGSKIAKNTSATCALTLLYNTNANITDDVKANVTADWVFIQE